MSFVKIPVVEYPSSDGEPMAESDYQYEPLTYAADSLKVYFQDRADVYVAANHFVYYEEGVPSSVVAPDVYVVLGAAKRKRDSYLLWKEPKGPDFVLEITSRSTRTRDQREKRDLYKSLGVTEYFCFDPTLTFLDPPLIGHRLSGGRYIPIRPKYETETSIALHSKVLGLDLRVIDDEFRFVNPLTGEALRSLADSERDRLAEIRMRFEERRRRLESDQRAAEADQRVAEADQRVAEATQRVAESDQRAVQAEARIRELQAQLAAKRTHES